MRSSNRTPPVRFYRQIMFEFLYFLLFFKYSQKRHCTRKDTQHIMCVRVVVAHYKQGRAFFGEWYPVCWGFELESFILSERAQWTLVNLSGLLFQVAGNDFLNWKKNTFSSVSLKLIPIGPMGLGIFFVPGSAWLLRVYCNHDICRMNKKSR